MPPQNQNYFILLIDGVGERALVVSKADQVTTTNKKSFSAN